MKRLAAIAIIMVAALTVFAACGGDTEAPAAEPQRASPPPPPPAPAAEVITKTGPTVNGRAVNVELLDNNGPGPFSFSPADFSFNVGDVIDFSFVSEGAFHTFTVEELGIDVQVNAGEDVGFIFTFDKAGTYELLCVPHEALGMVGTITVTDTGASQAPAPAPAPPAAPVAASDVKVDMTDGGGPGPFAFDPADFTFSAGEVVNFSFVGESQFHTFTVADLDINVDVNGGEVVEFSFTFDKPGTYELICVPHEALGMVGTITVQ